MNPRSCIGVHRRVARQNSRQGSRQCCRRRRTGGDKGMKPNCPNAPDRCHLLCVGGEPRSPNAGATPTEISLASATGSASGARLPQGGDDMATGGSARRGLRRDAAATFWCAAAKRGRAVPALATHRLDRPGGSARWPAGGGPSDRKIFHCPLRADDDGSDYSSGHLHVASTPRPALRRMGCSAPRK